MEIDCAYDYGEQSGVNCCFRTEIWNVKVDQMLLVVRDLHRRRRRRHHHYHYRRHQQQQRHHQRRRQRCAHRAHLHRDILKVPRAERTPIPPRIMVALPARGQEKRT